MMELKEIPTYMIWMAIVFGAFIAGIGVGYLLQGPEKFRPGKKDQIR